MSRHPGADPFPELRWSAFERSPHGSDNGLRIRTVETGDDATAYMYRTQAYREEATASERRDEHAHALVLSRELNGDDELFVLSTGDDDLHVTRSDATRLVQALVLALADPAGHTPR